MRGRMAWIYIFMPKYQMKATDQGSLRQFYSER